MIHESFDNWRQSPISTTIETLPISKITFPNVTVCPPKNLFLNLNHDIRQSENIKLDEDKRKILTEASFDILQEYFYNEMMSNLSIVQYPDRFYNWYHGYTRIRYPYCIPNLLRYYVYTTAISGNMSTEYFEGNAYIFLSIYVPPSVIGDENTTMTIDIKRRNVEEVIDNDDIRFTCPGCTNYHMEADQTHWAQNITAPKKDYDTILFRKVFKNDVRSKKKPEIMPSFGLSWYFDKELEPEAKYSNDAETKEFVRWEY